MLKKRALIVLAFVFVTAFSLVYAQSESYLDSIYKANHENSGVT